jgi:hypothetical protein
MSLIVLVEKFAVSI